MPLPRAPLNMNSNEDITIFYYGYSGDDCDDQITCTLRKHDSELRISIAKEIRSSFFSKFTEVGTEKENEREHEFILKIIAFIYFLFFFNSHVFFVESLKISKITT